MLLIKNGYIKPMVGDDIENGCVLIGDDGKIKAVGKDIKEDGCERVIDAGNRLVTPGCIDAHTHIGVHTSSARWEAYDMNENSDTLTPHLRAIDAIYPLDETFPTAIEHGVTAALTGPGSANVIGGAFAAIKLHGKCVDKMIIKFPVAMKCAFGENTKENYPGKARTPITRMGSVALLREMLIKTKLYLEAKEAGKEPAYDIKLEAMIPVIKGEIPLKAHAHRSDDILTAIRVAKEFNVKLTLDHCTDGDVIADEIKESGFPAFVGPYMLHRNKREVCNRSAKTPATLYNAGVPISIITDAPVVPIESLTWAAGNAVAEGLPMDEAWRAITINPATQTGIGDRVGSLEVGKDADVVIWTADPLVTVGAKAYITIVDGKVVYENQ